MPQLFLVHLFKPQKHEILPSGFLKGQCILAITESKTELKLKQISSTSPQFSPTLNRLPYSHLGPCYTEMLNGSMNDE